MTSETDHGISEQPPATCPMLDRALDEVSSIQELVDNVKEEDDPDLETLSRDVERHHSDAEAAIEDARDNVCHIRAWGQEWKDYAKGLLGEIEDYRRENESLQEEKDDLESQLEEIDEEEEVGSLDSLQTHIEHVARQNAP